MTLIEAYEAPGGMTYRLVRIDNPRFGRKFGWYIDDAEGTPMPDFYMPLAEPEVMAQKRAREHARHLGYHVVKVPV